MFHFIIVVVAAADVIVNIYDRAEEKKGLLHARMCLLANRSDRINFEFVPLQIL